MSGTRLRATPQQWKEYSEMGVRERFSKLYRDHPPDFTVTKEVANTYGVTYFLVMLFLESYLLGSVIIPHLVESDQVIYYRLVVLFLFVETFYNWFQCIRKYVNKALCRPEDSNKRENMGWKQCAICQYYAPPRSHHCKLCRACILRQDHHCFFTAGCIGLFTTTYFIFMSLWMLVAQIFVLYWIIAYADAEFRSWLMYFPPTSFWASLTGSQPWFHFFLVFLTMLILVNIVGSFFYLFMGIMAAMSNVTFYEGSKGIRRYRTGSTLGNLRAALGSYYWIRWLVPFYVAPEGDGYDWIIYRHEQ